MIDRNADYPRAAKSLFIEAVRNLKSVYEHLSDPAVWLPVVESCLRLPDFLVWFLSVSYSVCELKFFHVIKKKKPLGSLGFCFQLSSEKVVRMASSSELETAAFLARGFGVVGDAAGAPDYRVLLPSLPTGVVTLNSIVLYGDVTGRPYRVLDFEAPLKSVGVLNDIEWM